MTKEIALWVAPFDSSASIIGVRLNNEIDWTYTNLAVQQKADKTYVWNYKTGREVLMPRTRYTLSNDEGQKQLADDLDSMGLIGKRYSVWKAVENAEPFHTGDDAADREAMRCYEDCFDLGDFLFDSQALRALKVIQSEHDWKARKVLTEHGYQDDLEGSGACYSAHLFRTEADGTEVQVEDK